MRKRRAVVAFVGSWLLLLLPTWWTSGAAASTSALSIEWHGDLDFGRFVAFGSGAVRVAPGQTCQRFIEFGNLIDMGPCSAARFLVTGEANRSYVVNLPATSIQMPRFGDWWIGGHGPVVSHFIAASPNNYVLGSDGEDTVFVGGTLFINAGLAPEQYFGVLDVTVELE